MRMTKFVVTSQNSDVLPSDMAMKIYESGRNINIKETCFGVMIDGEDSEVEETVKEIRALDPNGIFVKDRGFPPGDPRRCRGHRGGGARPGLYSIEYESKILPLISIGLTSEERGEKPVYSIEKKKWLNPDELEKLIEHEFS